MGAERPRCWTEHHPDCPYGTVWSDYEPCTCPSGWPRMAAKWGGVTVIGKRKVRVLLDKAEEAAKRAVLYGDGPVLDLDGIPLP